MIEPVGDTAARPYPPLLDDALIADGERRPL